MKDVVREPNISAVTAEKVAWTGFQAVRSESLDSQLLQKLMDHVLSGSISPGERLPSERVMADALQVSRQSVRTAMKSLAALGIVDTRVGSGSYLVNQPSALLPQVIQWGVFLSQGWATDLIDARCQLEVLLAGMAAERRSEAHLDELRQAYQAMEQARDDYLNYAEADTQFHLAVANASENSLLATVLGNVRSMMQAWSVRVITTAGETATSLPLHENVLKAIEASDSQAAREAMERHMARAVRRLRESQR